MICDFEGFKAPEMIKRRPVVVVSNRLRKTTGLCTVVPCSTTQPAEILNCHYSFVLDPPLPSPHDAHAQWVKCDMVYTVSFDRLSVPFIGKDANGKRIYDQRTVTDDELNGIRKAILHGLGFSNLTHHL